jgi:hypothetical protein
VPTIFYTLEQQENNSKEFISINITNSSDIVIDSFRFNTNIYKLIDIEFSTLQSKNFAKDSTKWSGRIFPGEHLKIFIYCTKTKNFNYEKNIKNSIIGKYRDSKDFLWKDVFLKRNRVFLLVLTSLEHFAAFLLDILLL